MVCENPDCDSGKPAKIRGYCQGCYHRLMRKGTLARSRLPNAPGTICAKDGCKRTIFAKGFCATHYQQQMDPMKTVWKLIRSRNAGDYDPAWESFDRFVELVGRRPGDGYQLRRIDRTRPWDAENCEWREPVRVNGRTGITADMAAYQRAWSYLRKFGLREEDIARMREEQDDKCPVCDEPLEMIHEDTGKPVKLCVDHDHTIEDRRASVRGILHDHCNKGIGQLGESAANCRRAAAYLDRFAAKPGD